MASEWIYFIITRGPKIGQLADGALCPLSPVETPNRQTPSGVPVITACLNCCRTGYPQEPGQTIGLFCSPCWQGTRRTVWCSVQMGQSVSSCLMNGAGRPNQVSCRHGRAYPFSFVASSLIQNKALDTNELAVRRKSPSSPSASLRRKNFSSTVLLSTHRLQNSSSSLLAYWAKNMPLRFRRVPLLPSALVRQMA